MNKYESVREKHLTHQSQGKFYSYTCGYCRENYSLGMGDDGKIHLVKNLYKWIEPIAVCSTSKNITVTESSKRTLQAISCIECVEEILEFGDEQK